MAAFLDLGRVPTRHCDACLDDLQKAMAADPDGQEGMLWSRVANEWLADHVETASARLLELIERVRVALVGAMAGQPMGSLLKAWERWDTAGLAQAKMRLESKASSLYTVEDWGLLIEFLLQRWLPDDVLRSEAEHLTVKSKLLGMLQANMANAPALPPAPVVRLVPTTFAKVPAKVLTPVEAKVLHIAHEHAATALVGARDSLRRRVKLRVLEHVQAKVLGQAEGTAARLETRLFDDFAETNRDMRRIAVTEAGECCNTGFIAAVAPGGQVRRQEAYKGACDFCASINGKVFTVVPPGARVKNGATDVWVGKSNVGRSAALHRRVLGKLVERAEGERWWPAAGVQHPNCRGSWMKVPDKAPPGSNPAFIDWMDKLLAEKLPTPGV